MSKSNETTPNVPTLRFGGFSDLWNKSTIEKNAKVYDGTHQTPIYTKSGVKFVSVENIKDLYSSDKYISIEDYNSDFKYVPEINDILMTRIGDIGTPALVTKSEPLAYYVSLALLKEIDLEPHFLYHYIQTAPFQKELWRRTLHVAFPKKINKNEIGDCAIFYPSTRCEQKKVALFLDGIEKRIKIQNKIISKYETLIKGLSCDYFSKQPNHIAKLKDLIIKGKAGGTPSSTIAEYYNGNIPFLSISDMTRQGKYVEFTEKHISENGLANSSAWIVPSNSLILSMYASVGLVCINKVPLATSQAMFSMVLKDCNMLDYIYYYLNFFRETQIHRLLETGTQSNINADTVRDIEIPFYSNIFVFVKTLQAIENRLNNEKDMLSRLMDLKTYLLSSLFI